MVDYRRKVVVIIPSSVIKNTFVNSGSLDKLSSESDLIFFRSPDADFLNNSKIIDLNLTKSIFLSRIDVFFWYFYLFLQFRAVMS